MATRPTPSPMLERGSARTPSLSRLPGTGPGVKCELTCAERSRQCRLSPSPQPKRTFAVLTVCACGGLLLFHLGRRLLACWFTAVALLVMRVNFYSPSFRFRRGRRFFAAVRLPWSRRERWEARGPDHIRCSKHYRSATEHLRAKTNSRQVNLIGTSFGGGISAYYASRYPDQVERLVLFNPLLNYKEPLYRRQTVLD